MVLTFNSAPDLNVLAATMAFAVVATLMAGVGPAWRATRPDLIGDLKEQAGQPAGPRRLIMRNMLVVGQVALSLALLTAAGLFMRGAVKASVADPGFALDGVLVNVSPQLAGYDETRSAAALRAVVARVRNTPGIESASLASLVPFGDIQEGRTVQKAGTPPAADGQKPAGVGAGYMVIGADYFATLRLPILRGRGFTQAEEDSNGGARVAIIDEPLATQLFGAENAVGQRIQFAPRDGVRPEPLEVVGVATGMRDDMFDKVPTPHVYLPYGQAYRGSMFVHAKLTAMGDAAEAAMLGTLRQEIRGIDPNLPILALKTLRQHRDTGIGLWAVTSGARVFSIFGAVALLMAVVGVYGLKSYVVSRRTREIGVRMALGATPSDVLWMVMREGLVLTGAGIALGGLLSFAVAKMLSGMLYQVSAIDPIVFAVAPALMAAAALGASYVPARRATAVQPLAALRSE
jgi:predicted permease